MERRAERSESIPQGAIVDAAASLALWLRAGRVQRGMSLDDVARVTKIQPRILERLEAGKLDGLPAVVFVRGFIRSVARCIGLDEREALQRYAACGGGAMLALGSTEIAPAARALVEAMADLAPSSATAARATPRRMLAVEDAEPVDAAAPVEFATGSLVNARVPEIDPPPAAAPAPAVAVDPDALASIDESIEVAAPEAVAPVDAAPVEEPPAAEVAIATSVAAPSAAAQTIALPAPQPSKKKKGRRAKGRNKRKALAMGTPPGASPVVPGPASSDAGWTPRMPFGPFGSAPWRKPACAASSTIAPRLVIDDADPDSAELALEERAERQAPRRSLLPPILLDREDRSARQGGLTLAVIILLIAATLTLSYLMRRPGASGDGMTLRGPASSAASDSGRA
jgi:cytoskeleton protein RodZ